jgi:glyoxylase-like metal-dependent hydrolase (beta-lactamase superfamily II)
MPNRRRHWCTVLHQRGRERLDLLLNTHLHSDHCGGNAALHAAMAAASHPRRRG